MSELNEMIEKIGKEVVDFRARYDGRVAGLEKHLNDLETHMARGQFPGGGSSLGSGAVLSVAAKEHKDGFLSWARKGTDPDGLRRLEVQAVLQTQDDPSGGFLVPEEMDHSLDRLAIDSVAMRRLARIVTASGHYSRPFSAVRATGGWVGEVEERAVTDTPELKLFSPPWSELYALPEVTQALLDMSDFDVEAWLLDELQIVETEMEGAAFISGNGVKQPKGILQYETVANASWEWGKIGYIAGGHASLLNNADKIFDLQHALKPIYRQNGIFLMNDATLAIIRKFKDGEGRYLWMPGLLAGAPDTLLGKPVEIDDNIDDIGAGKYPIAFADWVRAYTIGDHRVGRRLLRDPYTHKGWVRFYLVKRVFGGIYNHQAIKFMKIAES